MLDFVLNNPHYFMLGMIGVFVAVVIVMVFLALSQPQQTGSGDAPPTLRPRDDRD